MKRVFAVDVLRCGNFGARREGLALLPSADPIPRILTHLALTRQLRAAQPPPIASARPAQSWPFRPDRAFHPRRGSIPRPAPWPRSAPSAQARPRKHPIGPPATARQPSTSLEHLARAANDPALPAPGLAQHPREAAGTSRPRSLAANDRTLSADGVPNQPDLFFHAANPIEVPFGDGLRCAGGGLVRSPIGLAAGTVATTVVDLPSAGIRAPGPPHFQCWFRDPAAGGAGYDTSDALRVTFVP